MPCKLTKSFRESDNIEFFCEKVVIHISDDLMRQEQDIVKLETDEHANLVGVGCGHGLKFPHATT